MTEDGLYPIRYSDLLKRLEEFGVVEEDDPALWAGGELGCRVIRKAVMGVGTPYVVLRVEEDEAMVYPPVVRHLLKRLSIEVRQFLMFE